MMFQPVDTAAALWKGSPEAALAEQDAWLHPCIKYVCLPPGSPGFLSVTRFFACFACFAVQPERGRDKGLDDGRV
jgi:hypothetical protein